MNMVSYAIYSDNDVIYTCIAYQEMLQKEKEFKKKGFHNVWHKMVLKNIVMPV